MRHKDDDSNHHLVMTIVYPCLSAQLTLMYKYLVLFLLLSYSCTTLNSTTVNPDTDRSNYTLLIAVQDLPNGAASHVLAAINQLPCHVEWPQFAEYLFFREISYMQADYYNLPASEIDQVMAALGQCPGVLSVTKKKIENVEK